MNAKYRELADQLERERNWPGLGYREMTEAERLAYNSREERYPLPPGRYATIATVEVECNLCHRVYQIACLSTCVPQCPHCRFGLPYFPQQTLDLKPPPPKTFEELGWPP